MSDNPNTYAFIEQYKQLCEDIDKFIDADKSILGPDAYLQTRSADIIDISESQDGTALVIIGSTWTNRFGGNYESWSATILKSDLELFQLKQTLDAPSPDIPKLAALMREATKP